MLSPRKSTTREPRSPEHQEMALLWDFMPGIFFLWKPSESSFSPSETSRQQTQKRLSHRPADKGAFLVHFFGSAGWEVRPEARPKSSSFKHFNWWVQTQTSETEMFWGTSSVWSLSYPLSLEASSPSSLLIQLYILEYGTVICLLMRGKHPPSDFLVNVYTWSGRIGVIFKLADQIRQVSTEKRDTSWSRVWGARM